MEKDSAARFLEACSECMDGAGKRTGIGTLGEKTLHAVLKQYFEPRKENQEVPVGPYVADICNEQGIFEIQTRGFDRLREKLAFFLELGPVTVVYPVPARKWLIWIEEDGTDSPRRKSPKSASACEIFPELYKLKPLLSAPNLRLCIVMLELEEYRLKNGWGNGGKRGSTRFDRMPVNLLEELWITSLEEYRRFLPESLQETFTVRDFASAARMSAKAASAAVNVLYSVGALERTGKLRNAFLYRRADSVGPRSSV